jgi:hypothetical protein
MPGRDADSEEPEGPREPDWRRLLDGFAEPGRLRRLNDRERRREASRCRRLQQWLPRRVQIWPRRRG